MNHELLGNALNQEWQPRVRTHPGSPDMALPVHLWRLSGFMTVFYQLNCDDMAFRQAPFEPGPTTRFIEEPDGPQDTRRPQLKALMSASFPTYTLYYFPTMNHLGRNLAQAVQNLHRLIHRGMIVGVGLEADEHSPNIYDQAERGDFFFYSCEQWPWLEHEPTPEHSAWQEGALSMLAVLESKRFTDASMRRHRVIEQARAQGKPIGAPHKLTPHQAEQAQGRIEGGESRQQIARELGVSERTLVRAIKRLSPET